MTREYPVEGDPKKENPPAEPLWEGMLEDGDVLYIPRGWWHVAIPLDEPTLHLTFGIHRVNGLDFMSWFLDRLRAHRDMRNDLPRLGSAEEKQQHLERLRQVVDESWTPGLFDEYFRSLDTHARSRPQFALPWTATPGVLPPEDKGWSVKWLAPRLVEPDGNPDEPIIVRGNGKEATFAPAARPILEELQAHGTWPIEKLKERSSGDLPIETLRVFVSELIDAGLASIVVEGRSA